MLKSIYSVVSNPFCTNLVRMSSNSSGYRNRERNWHGEQGYGNPRRAAQGRTRHPQGLVRIIAIVMGRGNNFLPKRSAIL